MSFPMRKFLRRNYIFLIANGIVLVEGFITIYLQTKFHFWGHGISRIPLGYLTLFLIFGALFVAAGLFQFFKMLGLTIDQFKGRLLFGSTFLGAGLSLLLVGIEGVTNFVFPRV